MARELARLVFVMGPHPGNGWGLAADGGGTGITPEISLPAHCKDRTWGVKTCPPAP